MSKETVFSDTTPEEEDEYLEQLWGIKCDEDNPFNESLSQGELEEEKILREIYEEDEDKFIREVSKKFEDHVWLFSDGYSITVHKIYNSLDAFARNEKFKLSPKSFSGNLFEWKDYTYTLEPLEMIF